MTDTGVAEVTGRASETAGSAGPMLTGVPAAGGRGALAGAAPAGAAPAGAAAGAGAMARRWDELEHRGRALLPEAACKVDEGGDLSTAWLASASRWLAEAAAGGWAELIGPLPRHRAYRRIVASPNLEAWVIHWPEGGRLQLHDHGGASGALTVVTGTLDEHFLPRGQGPGRFRSIEAGYGVAFDGRYVHDVYNTRAVAATSVHVYSSARRSMAFYDLVGGSLRRLDKVVDGASIVEQDQAADQGFADE